VTRYFERFRDEIARYAEGIHRLGEPADPAALRDLPAEYADFLRSWDGADLFHEDVHVRGAGEAEREGGEVVFAEDAAGSTFALGADGVIEYESDTGLRWRAASTLERWLDGVMAYGALLYERDGEFREGAFAGEELAPAVELKLARKRVKLDPEAPKPHFDLGMALLREGNTREASRELERAAEIDRTAAWPWFELGKLRFGAGDAAAALDALAQAAQADPEHEHAGFFAAWAARAAQAAGDRERAEEFRTQALARDPGLAGRQVAAAQAELEAGRKAEALEQVELALAVAPRDMQALDLRRRLTPSRAR
jgi:tetratricopeptide (TPR) repeat protein